VTYASVCCLLWNGAMYGGKILLADVCRLCVTHGLGLMSMGLIVTIYFHSIQHHISASDLHLTEGKQNTKPAECHIPYTVPSPSANIFAVQCVYGCRQITFSADSARKAPEGTCSAISIQAETENSNILACHYICRYLHWCFSSMLWDVIFLQCFDAVGWVAGRSSGL